jgi:hypothetical protein
LADGLVGTFTEACGDLCFYGGGYLFDFGSALSLKSINSFDDSFAVEFVSPLYFAVSRKLIHFAQNVNESAHPFDGSLSLSRRRVPRAFKLP